MLTYVYQVASGPPGWLFISAPLDKPPHFLYSSPMHWTPDKITALVLIIIAALLLFTGIDGEVKSILVMAAGYLFGVSIADRKK